MPQEQMPPQGAPQAGGADAEAQIVDQIGQLIQQLSPEKAAQVVMQLQELLGGESEKPAANVSPEGGPQGKPVGPGGM